MNIGRSETLRVPLGVVYHEKHQPSIVRGSQVHRRQNDEQRRQRGETRVAQPELRLKHLFAASHVFARCTSTAAAAATATSLLPLLALLCCVRLTLISRQFLRIFEDFFMGTLSSVFEIFILAGETDLREDIPVRTCGKSFALLFSHMTNIKACGTMHTGGRELHLEQCTYLANPTARSKSVDSPDSLSIRYA